MCSLIPIRPKRQRFARAAADAEQLNRLCPVAGLARYLHFSGTARAALSFYAEVFGGAAQLYTSDGQVIDRYRVHWMVGSEGGADT